MTTLDHRLAELAAKFVARLPAEGAALTAALEHDDPEALLDHAHKLAGSAGLFGHQKIGVAALALEEAILAQQDFRPRAETLVALLASASAHVAATGSAPHR